MFFNKSRRFQWFHQEMHQNTPQKKGKKRGLPYYLMRQPRFCVVSGRPKFRLSSVHVGAAPPANPYLTVGPRQQSAPNLARRPTMLAPSHQQSLISPSGHANRSARIPPGDRPCWRPSAGKTLSHHRATPTGRPESRPPTGRRRLRRETFFIRKFINQPLSFTS